MKGMIIEPKHLRIARASEMVPGAVFYLLNDDGTFSRCCIEPDELTDAQRRFDLKAMTMKHSKANKLYFRRDAPGKGLN